MPREEHIGHNIGPDERNKILNIGTAMYGWADPAFRDKKEDPSEGYTSQLFGDGWEQMPAPSTGKRRRALWIGYHRGMQVLVVIFTTKTRKTAKGRAYYGDTQPWIKYLDVDLDMWDDLAGYHSTGEWLKFSGVENKFYYPTRASDIDEMTQKYLDGLKQQ